MKEEKLLECSNYTLYKRLVPIRLKAIKFFFFFDFIFHKLKNFFFETTSEWVFSISFFFQIDLISRRFFPFHFFSPETSTKSDRQSTHNFCTETLKLDIFISSFNSTISRALDYRPRPSENDALFNKAISAENEKHNRSRKHSSGASTIRISFDLLPQNRPRKSRSRFQHTRHACPHQIHSWTIRNFRD